MRLPCVTLAPGQRAVDYPVLADAIRYAGQPVALVVARSEAAAHDAAELVDLDIEELPPVLGAEYALSGDAPCSIPSGAPTWSPTSRWGTRRPSARRPPPRRSTWSS
nr:hypothetical protein GCM10020093_042610 [Planobispora longispora]